MAAYINDHFVKNAEATIHVSDLSMQRGYAVFDFFRTVNGIPLFLDDHLERFRNSAEALHLQLSQTRDELSVVIHELINKSSIAEAGIRMMLTGGYSVDSYHPAKPNLIITCNPLKTPTQIDFEKGISVITHEHQRELSHIKSINYLMAISMQPLLKTQHADDILYYNKKSITEFPRSNVFIVIADNKLVTPAHNILYGITRKKILSLAADMMIVEERDITVDDLMNATEVFTTSTTKKVLPVIKVNNKFISGGKPGNITTALYEKFLALEKSITHLVSL